MWWGLKSGDLVVFLKFDWDAPVPGGYVNYPGEYSYNRRYRGARSEMNPGLVVEVRGEYVRVLVGGKPLWYSVNVLEVVV